MIAVILAMVPAGGTTVDDPLISEVLNRLDGDRRIVRATESLVGVDIQLVCRSSSSSVSELFLDLSSRSASIADCATYVTIM